MSRWRKLLATGLVLGPVLALVAALWLDVGTGAADAPPVRLGAHLGVVHGRYAHAAAVRAPRGVALLDAGQDPAGRDIDALLALMGAARADVHDIFLTSGRADHLAAVPLFAAARVWAGAGDVALARDPGRGQSVWGRLGRLLRPGVAVTVSHALTADEEVDLGGLRLRAIPVPGTSPGAYAYLVDGVLFVGDAARVVDGRVIAPPAGELSSPAATAAALRGLAAVLADVTVARICAAEGGCTPPDTGSALLVALAQELA